MDESNSLGSLIGVLIGFIGVVAALTYLHPHHFPLIFLIEHYAEALFLLIVICIGVPLVAKDAKHGWHFYLSDFMAGLGLTLAFLIIAYGVIFGLTAVLVGFLNAGTEGMYRPG